MMKLRAKAKQQKERGMALLLALFALLLLSAIGLFMVLASNTETHIDANYSNGLRSYYAARSGLEEVRDRVKYPSTPTNPTGSGLSDFLPQDVAGNAGGVLYVLNPASGETVDPTDPTSPYFDDQLCHDYASGVAAKDTKCSMLPGTPNWNKTVASVTAPTQPGYNPSTQLPYKWIRINMKTNRIADPYFVDNNLSGAPLDTRVCFDGQTEQLSPGGTNPSCDANGMQTVYMLTSLAATPQTGGPNGSRKLMRVEVVAPSIRPPGALTLGASTTAPTLINSSSSSPGIPTIAIDGRPHDIHGILSSSASCSMIAPLATDTPAGTAQLEQSLNLVRRGIVNQANTACNPDGSNTIGNICTAGLWWVRGTNPLSRFIVTGSSTSTPGSGTSTSTSTSSTSTSSTSGSTPGGSGRGGRDDDDSHGGHHHNDPSGAPDPTGACAATDPSCFTNLDLAAPELFATSALTGTDIPVVAPPADGIAPFTGGKGNQSDASIYQPSSASIIANEIKAVTDFASASTSDPSYYTVSSATLAASYGTSSNPAIVVFTDPTLSLQNNAVGLSGYGVLVISNGSLEITNAALNWNGIVVIQSPTGHVTLNSATGSINGALLLQPGAALSLQNSSTAVCGTGQLCTAFRLTYSCDAIDLAFTSKPFKIISTQGTSF
jgi:hypothetical protein